jgi:hypothetical protein
MWGMASGWVIWCGLGLVVAGAFAAYAFGNRRR